MIHGSAAAMQDLHIFGIALCVAWSQEDIP